MSSMPDLRQFRKQFQSMSKLNQKSTAAAKNHGIPLIDLNALDQVRESGWVDLGESGQQSEGRNNLPVVLETAAKSQHGFMTQRPALNPSPQPFRAHQNRFNQINGPSKQSSELRSSRNVDSNFFTKHAKT